MQYPTSRLRRNRRTDSLRAMVAESEIGCHRLIYPMFVVAGHDVAQPVEAMPGICRLSVDRLVPEAARLMELGIPAVLLFGVPDTRDAVASGLVASEGLVPTTVAALKQALPDLLVFADLCLCAFTDHGHCGVVQNGRIDNDATLPLLAAAALQLADAGVDMVAPSDMMDGRVGAVRQALDAAGHTEVGILSYAAKYASAFYGPFREAAGSAPAFGDRRTYQMDPANADEALREVALDIDEGADMVMVKPALAYLDVIHRVKQAFSVPLVAYNVSGEYAMVKAAAAKGWIDEDRVILETMISLRRAGADGIVTYFAPEVARILKTAGGGR